MVKGYTQNKGLDYHATFAPMAKLVSIHALLCLSAIKGWRLHQLDVNNAFSHKDSDEDVYMTLPLGFSHRRSHLFVN